MHWWSLYNLKICGVLSLEEDIDDKLSSSKYQEPLNKYPVLYMCRIITIVLIYLNYVLH